MSSSSDGGCSRRQGEARGERQRAVALAAAGPEAGGDGVRRREQQAVGAGPVAVGHDHDLRLAARPAEQRLELCGVERRAVAGDAEDTLCPLLERPLDAERHRRGLAVLRLVLDDESALAERGGAPRSPRA